MRSRGRDNRLSERRKETPKRCSVVALRSEGRDTPRISQVALSPEAARAMIRDARRYGIPVIRDDQLAELLVLEHPESEIPEQLYGIVAEYFVRLRLV